MTRPPPHLVFDQGERAQATELESPPPGPAGIHVHLHLGPLAWQQPTSAPAPLGRLGRGYWRPLLVGAAGVAMAFVAFELGARSGEGHALALAASHAGVSGLASLASNLPPPRPPTAANELPAAVRQQLAQPPTVIPPAPDAQQPAAGSNPFGLHP